MAHVTVVFGGITITIYSADAAPANSVDVQGLPENIGFPLAKVTAALTALDNQGATKHINCHAGQHRSATIAILYLFTRGVPPQTLGAAYDAVQLAFNPPAPAPSPNFFHATGIVDNLTMLLGAYCGVKLARNAPGAGFPTLRGMTYAQMQTQGLPNI